MDEMLLDGNPTLNLATFVTTWMEPEAQQLLNACAGKNMADNNIYPQVCVHIEIFESQIEN
jgi:glutamate decarboxylase